MGEDTVGYVSSVAPAVATFASIFFSRLSMYLMTKSTVLELGAILYAVLSGIIFVVPLGE